MIENGTKIAREDVVKIGKNSSGKTVWLEAGDCDAGLQHIIKNHADEFIKKGLAESDIAELVFKAATKGKIVGMQRTRPIFEVAFGGKTYKVAITIGDNGFIVGANIAS